MDTKDHPVISVLGDQRRFVVPIYQRQYAWGDERLLSFWEDVVAKAEEIREGKLKFSHYMGALILAPGGDGFRIGTTPRVLVIDGQQRLTTFQLFLAAVREIAAVRGWDDVRPSVENYLFAPQMSGDVDRDARYRLVPTPEDRSVFHLILDRGMAGVRAEHPDWFYGNGRLIRGRAPNAVRGLDVFIERIESYVATGVVEADGDGDALDEGGDAAGTARTRLDALLRVLLHHLKLVVITLSDDDDAQVIFETLNSKAEPLLAMDLVRNNIFHRAAARGESVEALFNEKWRPFDLDGTFWKADSPRAKPRRPRIDHFLSHALTAQTGEEASLRELYSEYRSFAQPRGQSRFASVADELDALVAFAPIYRTLEEGGDDADLAALGRRLALWEVSTAHPLVFLIAASPSPAEVKRQLYGLIYAYLVRRAVCGLSPKSYNKTFARLTGELLANGVSVAAFAAAFKTQRGDAVRFPLDAEFLQALVYRPLYEMFARKERVADLLWDLELATRTKFSAATPRPAVLSVEHVMPQSWPAHWPLVDGRHVPIDKMARDREMADEIERREAALHTLGNLTLITEAGNTVSSNHPFQLKRPWLRRSLLALNDEIDRASHWDVATIAERSRFLAERAVRIWPHPERSAPAL